MPWSKAKFFLFLLLAFIAGIALRSFTAISYVALWLIFILAAIILVWGILRKAKYILVGLILLAFLGGIFRYQADENAAPDLADYYGHGYAMRGIITEEPEISGSWQQLKMEINFLDEKKVKPFLALVTTNQYPVYFLGDEIMVRGSLKKPELLEDFDYPAYLAKDNIYAQVSFPETEKIASQQGNKLRQILSRAKFNFENNLERILPEPHAAFLKGLILGERESLPQDLTENFNRTGTTHIVALSGYNISLVADFFLQTLIFLTVPYYLAFWIAGMGITFFVVLTGASPSVVRAGIMGILVLVAAREGRVYSVTHALALAAVLMLWHNPKILRFDAAFQLSFLATLGLIFLSPHLQNGFDKLLVKIRPYRLPVKKSSAGRKFFPFQRMLAETLAAQIMVLPLLIYLFGRVSLISPLVNILVLLAVPYAMAMGFLAGILGFFSDYLASIPAVVAWVLLEYKIQIIEFFAGLPGAALTVGKWAILFLFPFYVLLLGKIWFKKWENI